MGRTVLADDRIQAYVDELFSRGHWNLGLIIGKLTGQKDYAIHLVRTPEPVEDTVSEEDDVGEEIVKKKKRRKSQCKPETLEAINEQWAATHCKQVTTMLPGGLDVIGVFALAPPDMMQASQVKLRQVMFAIQKMMKKSPVTQDVDGPTERLLLQICSTSRKLTCRSIDVSDPKSVFSPAVWKYQSSATIWHKLQTNVAVDLRIDIPGKSQNTPMLKQIQSGVRPFCERVWTGLTTFQGELRPGEETLDKSGDSKRGKGKDKGHTASQQCFDVNLLMKTEEEEGRIDPVVLDKANQAVIRGVIHSRSFVPGKATVGEAEQAMKMDVVRSLTSRCELLCDDIGVVEEDAVSEEMYNTPIRVFYQLPGTGLQLCDYMFQDEKIQEVIDRIKELLDTTVTEDDLDLSCERVATEMDCGKVTDSPEGSVYGEVSDTGSQIKYYIVAGLGGAVAFMVAGLSYMLAEESS